MRRPRFIAIIIGVLPCSPLSASTEDTNVIKQMYAASFAAIHDVRTRADVEHLFDSFEAPEWVGNMPAGETLTKKDAIEEGISVLSISPEKRPTPKMQYVYITETGWNILMVYCRYRETEGKIVGALYRDTWVRTSQGWRRTRTEKFFPDRPLAEAGKAPFPSMPD